MAKFSEPANEPWHGTISGYNAAGTIHVKWDDGSQLGLIVGQDRWEPCDGGQ